jgi:hypothetical protein
MSTAPDTGGAAPRIWYRLTAYEWVLVLLVPTILLTLWILSIAYGDGSAPLRVS